MDRVGADFGETVAMMRERFPSLPIPICIPWGKEDGFKGVFDLIRNKAILWDEASLGLSYTVTDVPESYQEEVAREREVMIERVAENDDTFADKYLGGEDITEEDLIAALRRATLSFKIVPVLCGAALRNKGIQPLLDALVSFLPSPEEVRPIRGLNPLTREEEIRPHSVTAPLTALVFKIMQDEGRKLAYLRLYAGRIAEGDEVYNASRGKKERVSRLLKMHANKRERIEEALAGDIVAIMGLKEARTGDTLCHEDHPILLESIEFYEPVISQAIEPKTPADQEKLTLALAKLLEEDPTLRLKYDDETAQTVISGMGELHLEIVIDRLIREYNVHVNVGKPRVVYRETIQRTVEIERTFERELGEKRHFGHVRLRLSPRPRGTGTEIVNILTPEIIPSEYHSVIEEGVREGLMAGVIAGYPVIDIRVEVLGGSYREGESSPMAYKIATITAFRDGCMQAEPVLLEPIMMVDVITPSEFMGEIIGDINARRGEIELVTPKGPVSEIRARVPLKSMFGYSTDLRSLTQGRATFTMQFAVYDRV